MRKIIMFNMVTLDGYFAGVDGNIDWHVTDPEFDRWAAETIDEYDTVMLGRVTYDLFAGYWPSAPANPDISPDDLAVAKALNTMTKIVFSQSLDKPEWQNSKVLHNINPEEIQKLKQQDSKNIVIYGSGTIVRELTNLGLIDEYRFMLNPVILGNGKPLFKDVNQLNLKLSETRVFESGNVLLIYKPIY